MSGVKHRRGPTKLDAGVRKSRWSLAAREDHEGQFMQMKTKAGMKLKAKMKMPPSVRRQRSLDKDRIAEAVHVAVCEATDSDGSYKCMWYAHAGQGLLDHLGVTAEVQCGHLDIIEAGRVAKTLEYFGDGYDYVSGHTWLRAGGNVIDFAARHFSTYAGKPLSRPVDYIWGNRPGVARYTPLPDASAMAGTTETRTLDLWARAINAYEGKELCRPLIFGRTPEGLMLGGLARV